LGEGKKEELPRFHPLQHLAPHRRFRARCFHRRLALQLVEMGEEFAKHVEMILAGFGLGAD
jgi:hypothetical protein